jgi:hypothetical protein
MTTNIQSILSTNDTYDETAQSKSKGEVAALPRTMELLTNFENHQTLPRHFSNLSTEQRLQIWEVRVAAEKPQIIGRETRPGNDPKESRTNMGNYTTQKDSQAIFSARSALNCHLAHICFEAREVYLMKYKPLFGERKGHPIIYADLERDAVRFGPHFEMWHLQAFTSSVDATRIRRLILEYDHSLIQLSALQMGHALRNILKICLLFPKLKRLIFLPLAKAGLAKTRQDRHIQTNYQSKKKSQWVLRLIKPIRDLAPSTQGNWCERWEEEEQRMEDFLRRKLSEDMKEFRRKNPNCRIWGAPISYFE